MTPAHPRFSEGPLAFSDWLGVVAFPPHGLRVPCPAKEPASSRYGFAAFRRGPLEFPPSISCERNTDSEKNVPNSSLPFLDLKETQRTCLRLPHRLSADHSPCGRSTIPRSCSHPRRLHSGTRPWWPRKCPPPRPCAPSP